MPDRNHPSTHPPLPPTTEDDRVTWLRLLRSRRVGPGTFHRLLSDHGSVAAALDALPEVARAAGVSDYRVCPAGVAEAELRAGHAAGARLVTFADPAYPAGAARSARRAPAAVDDGRGGVLDRPVIALVGARNASSLGLRMARGLAADLCPNAATDRLRPRPRRRYRRAQGQPRDRHDRRHGRRGGRDLSCRKRGACGRYPAHRAAHLRASAGHGPAGAPLSRAQPPHQRPRPRRGRGRGRGQVRLAHHRAGRARSGARGARRAGSPDRRARLGLQHAHPRRRHAGAQRR